MIDFEGLAKYLLQKHQIPLERLILLEEAKIIKKLCKLYPDEIIPYIKETYPQFNTEFFE